MSGTKLLQEVRTIFNSFLNNLPMKLTRAKYTGGEIKKLRKEKGWTQLDLALAVGLSSVYIGYLENGRRKPTLRTLEKIAHVLKVRAKDLL